MRLLAFEALSCRFVAAVAEEVAFFAVPVVAVVAVYAIETEHSLIFVYAVLTAKLTLLTSGVSRERPSVFAFQALKIADSLPIPIIMRYVSPFLNCLRYCASLDSADATFACEILALFRTLRLFHTRISHVYVSWLAFLTCFTIMALLAIVYQLFALDTPVIVRHLGTRAVAMVPPVDEGGHARLALGRRSALGAMGHRVFARFALVFETKQVGILASACGFGIRGILVEFIVVVAGLANRWTITCLAAIHEIGAGCALIDGFVVNHIALLQVTLFALVTLPGETVGTAGVTVFYVAFNTLTVYI